MNGINMKKDKLLIVLAAAWITYTTAYLCRVNISTALDKLAVGLEVSLEYLGAASSVYFVTYAIGQLLNGIAGDRVNPYKFVILALVLTGGVNVVLGLQTSGVMFLVLWGLNGFCQSMFWSTLLRLLSFHAREGQRKNVSTVMSTTSVTGYLLSWVVLSDLFENSTFTPYFLVPGLIALALIPVWIVLSGKVPFAANADNRVPTPPLPVVAKEFLHDRLYFICLLCMVVGAIQEGAVFWLPMIFTDVLNLGKDSLFLLMLVPLAKLSGVFLARRMLTVLKENVRAASLCMLLVSLAFSLVLLIAGSHTSLLTVIIIALLIAVINAANWYMISYLPLYFAERNIVATLVGAFDFSTYIGAAVMSGTLGVLLVRHGWIAVPVLWTALVLLSLLLSFAGAGACLALRGKRRP